MCRFGREIRFEIEFGIWVLGPDLFGIWVGMQSTWVWFVKLGVWFGIPALDSGSVFRILTFEILNRIHTQS